MQQRQPHFICRLCKVRKRPTSFYASDPRRCKDCAKVAAASRREAKLDEIRAYDRARAKLPHRIAQTIATTKAWRKAHPERAPAQTKAQRMHRKAPRACQMCGLEKRLERHHPDYSLPTMIVWLCKPCHAIADRKRA